MGNGQTVFIAGSRSLSRLNSEVKNRIDSIIRKGFTVILGDANGIDKAVQCYLSRKHYRKVTVFYMEGTCRNNVGHWPTQVITAGESSRRDFTYYSTKDRAMVEEADYGLMLWDRRSRGTLRSIVDLVRRSKTVVVYISPERSFHILHRPEELDELLMHTDRSALQGVDRELRHFVVGASVRKPESDW